MQTVKEYLLTLMDAEAPAFVRVFEALPADKLDWRPDPKSKSALELVSTLAGEANGFVVVFQTGILNYDPDKKMSFATVAEAVAAFKSGIENSKAALKAMSDADWDSEAKMVLDGKDAWKTTRGNMGLGFMLDMIHHRGQLSKYIRPMGGKVPSIYGPSADMGE